jgi:GNAT superfamily N-acetyltransferase
MNPKITLTDKPDAAAAKALSQFLGQFNDDRSGWAFDYRPLAILITDTETNDVLGGLWGGTMYGFLHIDLLFVPEAMRGSGTGRTLMSQAEDEAIRRECRGVWLDTFSFQARGFYEKLGYTVFGEIENHPPGHSRFFLRKLF